MRSRTRQAKHLKQSMAEATSYREWLEMAEELDLLEGHNHWRHQDESPVYHYKLVRAHCTNLRKYRSEGKLTELLKTLEESTHRHLAEISAPELYQRAHAGTKHLIVEFLEEVEASMRYICDNDFPGMSIADKLENFELAAKVYGRTALLMSGGGAFGIYNLGVIKALLEEDILPPVISGSSMGSFVAVVIGSRSRDELRAMFENLDQIHTTALQMVSPLKMVQSRVILDSDQLFESIQANVGTITFKEAYEKSGLAINISVSPTRSRQKPRLLNYLTTPNVLLAQASLASCAIPGMFPPVTLKCVDENGAIVPYMKSELWADGTVYGDIPLMRMARLHNINKTIVSQSNPHVIPFMAMQKNASLPAYTAKALGRSLKAQSAIALDFARDNITFGPARSVLDKAHAVTAQDYHGDINIHLSPSPKIYRNILSNPDLQDLENYILMGKRATWPQIAYIRDLTRICRAFEQCIGNLRARTEAVTAQ